MDEIVTINTIVDLSQGNNQRFDLAKGEISPEKLAQHAFSFAYGFKDIINLITDPQKIDQIMHCEQIASIISLVDEILLKSLIYEGMKQEDLKKYIVEHDLYKLFQMIEENEQEALMEEYNKISKEPIEREGYLQGIAEIKDTFCQFRYCFELKGFALKQHFLLQFSKSLFNYCKEKRTVRTNG